MMAMEGTTTCCCLVDCYDNAGAKGVEVNYAIPEPL